MARLAMDLIDGLSSLADKSLLRPVEIGEGEPRFAMLGTIREYALERLAERGELAAMRQARTAYYLCARGGGGAVSDWGGTGYLAHPA